MSKNKIIEGITLGSDPEVMLWDNHTDQLISSIGIIPGYKDNPFDVGDGYFLTTDNVLGEYLIPPCKTENEFVHAIMNGQDKMRDFLPNHVSILVQASAIYPESELLLPEAREFGCSEDYCSWTQSINIKPTAEDSRLRSAGGHIHIGYKDPDIDTSELLVKYFDLFLTLPSLLLDEDVRRRELYGKAGCFRPKPYGFEARCLSNFWIKSPETISWAYNQIMQMVEYWNNGGLLIKGDEKLIQEAINSSDRILASEVMDKYGIGVVLSNNK